MHTIVLLHSWRLGLSATYLPQYLQQCNCLSISALRTFGCRWQMFLYFFNFIEEDYTSQNDAQNRIDFTHFCTVMDQYTNWLWHILHSLIDIFINYTYKLTNGIL